MTTKITEKNISSLANAGVQWQSVVVADGSTGLTTVAGRGYFINTTSGAQTVTLPASANVGDVVVLKDYARTWATNNITMASNTFDGVASQTPSFSIDGQTVTLVYMDNTQGWSLINEDTTTGLGAVYIAATGGTVTTSGSFKIHTFTGDGTFVVSQVGNPAGSTSVDYLVVAGGGTGGFANGGGGGGGAGGLRYSASTYTTPAPAPSAGTALPVSVTTYPITVGAGGASFTVPDGSHASGNDGSNSVFSTITSAGGGGGGGGSSNPPTINGRSGGSGGGGGKSPATSLGGSGNTPPVNPPQGNNGGNSATICNQGGGGGGAGAVGGAAGPGLIGGPGGNGLVISINNIATTYAGGGGGEAEAQPAPAQGQGGAGGGGRAGLTGASAGVDGGANTGGGGGAMDSSPAGFGVGAGGKGIVIIRYKFQ